MEPNAIYIRDSLEGLQEQDLHFVNAKDQTIGTFPANL